MTKTKPHPWICPECHSRAVSPAREPYEAEVEHDGRSYRVCLPNLELHRCSACGFTIIDDVGNRAISAELRRVAGLLQPEEIRKDREALGLTQKQLAGYLRVAEATLSRWETGGQIQQRALDHLLRAFFDVPEFRAYAGFGEQVPQETASVA